jgi:hypothetical protein
MNITLLSHECCIPDKAFTGVLMKPVLKAGFIKTGLPNPHDE